MLPFSEILSAHYLPTPQAIFELFKEDGWGYWVDEYVKDSHYQYGDITCQGFWGGFQYVIDQTTPWETPEFPASTLPQDRVVVAFGISTAPADQGDRKILRKYWEHAYLYNRFGARYNKGHLIARSMGGPIDCNIFPQLECVNLGHKGYGGFREMERYVAAHPGIFVFARPVYGDFSDCPFALEYGYCDDSLQFVTETFPNRP